MARKQWYFGRFGYTPTAVTSNQMLMLPAPDTGLSATRSGYVETLNFENGGAGVVRSAAGARTYECNFGVSDASGQGGLDSYTDLQQNYFGNAPIYVSDSMNFTTNVFPPNWASPGLTAQGWKPIYSSAPLGYTATAANSYRQPATSALYSVTTAANTIPTGGNASVFIPIPPGHSLYMGAAGSRTGTGVVQARPVYRNGGFAPTVDLTLLSPAGATRLNTTFSGELFSGVVFYITRTTAVSSTVTLASLMGQIYRYYAPDDALYPNTQVYPGVNIYPTSASVYSVYEPNGYFVPGRGQSGMEFSSEAIAESYTLVDNDGTTPRRLKGMSFTVTEVTPWRGGTI